MAMKMLTRKEFDDELRKAGLIRTDKTTNTGRLWKTPKGDFVIAPAFKEDGIPDHILDKFLAESGEKRSVLPFVIVGGLIGSLFGPVAGSIIGAAAGGAIGVASEKKSAQ